MVEAFFGSTSPMWTTIPSIGFPASAPLAGANRTMATTFGQPSVPLGQAVPAGGPSLQGVPAQSVWSPAPIPLAVNPLTGLVSSLNGDALLAPTPYSLLAAVAVRRGQPQGPTTEQEVEDFIYDALELLPGANEIEVRCEGGRVMLTGTVPHKRIKRDAGEIAWAIPGPSDVQNNVTITSRRRARAAASRDSETTSAPPARKQS